LRQVIVPIPLLAVLPGFLVLDGVWGAGPIADGVAALLTGGALVWQLQRLGAGRGVRP
jgi:hypothetical protein